MSETESLNRPVRKPVAASDDCLMRCIGTPRKHSSGTNRARENISRVPVMAVSGEGVRVCADEGIHPLGQRIFVCSPYMNRSQQETCQNDRCIQWPVH